MITTLGVGGAETQVSALVRRLRGRGWEPTVVSLLPDGVVAEGLREAGIAVTSLGMRRGIADPRAIFRLAGVFRRTRPDVVHAHMVHANLLARAARVVAPVPVLVCTAHNVDEEGRARELGYRLTDGLSDLLTNVSRHATERYRALGLARAGKLRYVPNGVDLERFRADLAARQATRASLGLDDRFTWLAVGRLDVQKDPETLVRAFAVHTRAVPHATLLLVGEGPLRGRVETVVREEGVQGAVRLLGTRADVPDLLRAADAFVLCSRWEGLPMVALEASASGLPVVATAVGGTDEIVLPGVTGDLVPQQDAASMAAALTSMATRPAAERGAMGDAGRAHVATHYELGRVVDEWERTYRELLGRRRARHGAVVALPGGG